MNVKLFETFAAVARLGNFRAAAAHLNTTQPAVSMRIRELERWLGAQLFERAQRKSFLTAKGEELLPLVDRLLGAMNDIRQHVVDPRTVSETVRVGVSELIAITWLSDLTADIGRRFPNVALRFDIDLVDGLTTKLRSRELDLVLCVGPLKEPELHHVSLGLVAFDWFVSPTFQLPAGRLTATDLAPLPLISLSPILHEMAIGWFRHSGISCRRANFCNSMNAVSLLVRAGQGVSILPTDYYGPYVDTGEVRILETDPPLPALEYFAVYFEHHASGVVRAIADISRETSLFRLPERKRKQKMREKLAFSEM